MKAVYVEQIVAHGYSQKAKAFEFRMKSGKTYVWKDPEVDATLDETDFIVRALIAMHMDSRSSVYLDAEDIETICLVWDLGVYQQQKPHIPQPDEWEPEKETSPKKAGWPVAPPQ